MADPGAFPENGNYKKFHFQLKKNFFRKSTEKIEWWTTLL